MTDLETPPQESGRDAPYVGIRTFDSRDEGKFHGRGHQIGSMMQLLAEQHFLAVVGASGSGKSSLIRAGLLPRINCGFLGRSKTWRFAVFTPGTSPFANLTEALLKQVAPKEWDDLEKRRYWEWTLRSSPRGVFDLLDALEFPDDARLLILVDQFEELFRFAGLKKDRQQEASDDAVRVQTEESLAFVETLLALISAGDQQVFPALTMRSEFLGDCEAFRGLSPAISQALYLVSRLDRAQLKETIEQPAVRRGATVAPAVVTHLLNTISLAYDQLPRLEHLLLRIWTRAADRAQRDGSPVAMTWDDYEAVGEFDLALDQHLNEVYDDLGRRPDGALRQRAARSFFVALCDSSPDKPLVRRPCELGQLARIAQIDVPLASEIVESFRRSPCFFLRSYPGSTSSVESTLIDVSHESLLRQWTRLRNEWLPAEQEAANQYRDLVADAELDRSSPSVDNLWRPPKLQLATDWWKKFAPNAAWARRYSLVDTEQEANVRFDAARDFLERSAREWEANIRRQEERRREEQARLEREVADEKRRAEESRVRAEQFSQLAASRQRLNVRLRAVLVVSVVLTVVAFAFRSAAERSAAQARLAQERSRQLLNERRIESAVEAFSTGFPRRGRDVLEVTRRSGGTDTLGWEWQYAQTFSDPRFEPFATISMPSHKGNWQSIRALALSHDGTRLAALGGSSVVVWQLTPFAAQPVWSWSPSVETDSAARKQAAGVWPFPNSVHFSADGKNLTVLGTNRLAQFELANDKDKDKREPRVIRLKLGASRICFSRDERRAWVVEKPLNSNDRVSDVDLESGQRTEMKFVRDGTTYPLGKLLGLALHPNDNWLLLLHQQERGQAPVLAVFDRSGRYLGHREVPLNIRPSYATRRSFDLQVYSAGTFLVIATGDGSLLGAGLSHVADGTIRIAPWRRPSVPNSSETVRHAWFAGTNGEWILTAEENGAMAWVDPYAPGAVPEEFPLVGKQLGVGEQTDQIVVSADGRVIAVADQRNTISLWRPWPAHSSEYELPIKSPAVAISLNPTGDKVAVATLGGVSVLDARSGRELGKLAWESIAARIADTLPIAPVTLTWRPQRETLFVGTDDTVVEWAPGQKQIRSRISTQSDVVKLAIAPSGTRLAIAIGEAFAPTDANSSLPIQIPLQSRLYEWQIWDLDRGKSVEHEKIWSLAVESLAFHPSQSNWLAAYAHGTIEKLSTSPGVMGEKLGTAPKENGNEFYGTQCLIHDFRGENAFLCIRDTQGRSEVWRLDLRTRVFSRLESAPVSPIEQILVLPGSNGPQGTRAPSRLAILSSGEARICSTSDGREVLRLRVPDDRLVELSSSRLGDRIAARLESGRVVLWETRRFDNARQLDVVLDRIDAALRSQVFSDDVERQFHSDSSLSSDELELSLIALRDRGVTRHRLIEWACEFLQLSDMPPATLRRVEQRLKAAKTAHAEDQALAVLHSAALIRFAQLSPNATVMDEARSRLSVAQESLASAPPELRRLAELFMGLASYKKTGRNDRALQLLFARGVNVGTENSVEIRPLQLSRPPTKTERFPLRDEISPEAQYSPGDAPAASREQIDEASILAAFERLSAAVEAELRRLFRVELGEIVIQPNNDPRNPTINLSLDVEYCESKELIGLMNSGQYANAVLNDFDLGKPRPGKVERRDARQVLTWQWGPVPLHGPIAKIEVHIKDPSTNADVVRRRELEIPPQSWPDAWRARPALHLLAVEVTELNAMRFSRYSDAARRFPDSRDAESLRETLRTRSNDLYRPGSTTVLRGPEATKAAIIDAFATLAASVAPTDVAIVYFGGPGWKEFPRNEDDQKFGFPTYDDRLEWTELQTNLQNPACRYLVFFDMNNAADLSKLDHSNQHANCFLLLGNGRFRSDARIEPRTDGKIHGAFSWLILDGLRGQADTDRSGKIDLKELVNHVRLKRGERVSSPTIIPEEIAKWPLELPLVSVPNLESAP